MSSKIPSLVELQRFLNAPDHRELNNRFMLTLIGPLREFCQRPSKGFRGRLVKIGASLSDSNVLPTSDQMNLCEEVVELLHSASLIIDDVQDGSKMRRGKASLHEIHGTSVAINAGNWLYFWPMEKIRRAKLKPEVELKLYRSVHDTLIRAHCGQALDVGVSIDQIDTESLPLICDTTIQLKTGALMAMAMSLGAILAEASENRVKAIQSFGVRFGSVLQMFDDIGNLSALKNDPTKDSKKLEDLIQRRPTWVWSFVAREMGSGARDELKRAVEALPRTKKLTDWIEKTQFKSKARQHAIKYLHDSLQALENFRDSDSVDLAREALGSLGENIAGSY